MFVFSFFLFFAPSLGARIRVRVCIYICTWNLRKISLRHLNPNAFLKDHHQENERGV